jgi:hypothetical protein
VSGIYLILWNKVGNFLGGFPVFFAGRPGRGDGNGVGKATAKLPIANGCLVLASAGEFGPGSLLCSLRKLISRFNHK